MRWRIWFSPSTLTCDYSRSDYSPGKISVDYLTCLLEVRPPEVVKKAYKIICQQNLDEGGSRCEVWLGQQMERQDFHDLAFELYKTAAK
jgi:hypothetical protein